MYVCTCIVVVVVVVLVVVIHTYITGKPGPSSTTLAPHFSDWDVIRVTRVGENGPNTSVRLLEVKIWDSVQNVWGRRAGWKIRNNQNNFKIRNGYIL